MDRTLGTVGALSGMAAVAAGAFGAHALRGRLTPDLLAVFETAARYQMYHALAILVAAAPRDGGSAFQVSGWLFVAGTVLFSGSLYGLALTGTRGLGAVTPLGGLALLCGWAALAWGIWQQSA
jgi:uncharacterized membrane protein YgdD (TMEM256/DUF423 family)